ncbi:hypothetical protein K439DRAFT_1658193 [Ramaria rubella]|nr:hypothetical protein K439DRAFT_1658193 [Ramaria rubella]
MPNSKTHYTSSNPSIGTATPEDRDLLLQAMQDNIMVTKEVVAGATQAAEKCFNKIDESIADVRKHIGSIEMQNQSAMLNITDVRKHIGLIKKMLETQSVLLERLSKEIAKVVSPLAGCSIIIRMLPTHLCTHQVVHLVWAAKDREVDHWVIEVDSPQDPAVVRDNF